MKKYIVPQIMCIELRVEERLSSSTSLTCLVGSCVDEDGNLIYSSSTTVS